MYYFFKHARIALFISILALALVQCSDSNESGSSTSGSSGATSTTTFPSDLAITSPTKNASSGSGASMIVAKASSSYDIETTAIQNILTATSLSDCVDSFFGDLTSAITNANCYGPQVDYVNHPDGTGGNDPLPSGDVGLWTENEGSTTEACAAAQLNTRMEGVKDKTIISLKTLASMICTINNTSTLSLPSAGSSVIMTSEMNNMLSTTSLSPVPTVNSAALSAASNSVGTTDYTYSINITYTIGSSNVTLQTDMTHRPLDSSNSTYLGRFSYYFNSTDTLGNCNNDFGSLNTSNITELGSVTYEKGSSTSLRFNSRYAQACGNGNTDPFNSSNILDPNTKAITSAQTGGPDLSGWASNFTIMAADFDPNNNQGNYYFAWQAGTGDGTARTFNVHLEDNDSDGLLDGSAFFGFGEEIGSSTVGTINGIYCNWAGPAGGVGNQTSKRQSLVQKQTMEENSTSGIFEATSSNINYAPTLDCNADASDIAAGFSYDSDGDGILDTITAFTNNLIDPSDTTNGIAASSYTAPVDPTGL